MITKDDMEVNLKDFLTIRKTYYNAEIIFTRKLIKYLKQEKDYSTTYPVVSTWKCEDSPISYCVYEDAEDPYHDNCIFCGQPEERY